MTATRCPHGWCHLNHDGEPAEHESPVLHVDGLPTLRGHGPSTAESMVTLDVRAGRATLFLAATAELDEAGVEDLIVNLAGQVRLMRAVNAAIPAMAR